MTVLWSYHAPNVLQSLGEDVEDIQSQLGVDVVRHEVICTEYPSYAAPAYRKRCLRTETCYLRRRVT
jgi:hypothetical protein